VLLTLRVVLCDATLDAGAVGLCRQPVLLGVLLDAVKSGSSLESFGSCPGIFSLTVSVQFTV